MVTKSFLKLKITEHDLSLIWEFDPEDKYSVW